MYVETYGTSNEMIIFLFSPKAMSFIVTFFNAVGMLLLVKIQWPTKMSGNKMQFTRKFINRDLEVLELCFRHRLNKAVLFNIRNEV